MGRKRNPYIQLFTRDILSSPRCRALSESAAGVYLFLLCRLNEPPTPGAYRISDWELHPTWKRSCTQQCVANPNKYERLQYFAKMLSKNDLPWKTATILVGLQELYKYGIITVEGDMLIQPRMFKDNGFDLPDLDNDGDPEDTILGDPASGSMALRGDDDFSENKGANNGAISGTQNGTKKVRNSHAPATRVGSEYEIMSDNNNIGNIGGTGESDGPPFDDFWDLYDKKTNRSGDKQYCVRQWYNLSPQERQAAMDFLPQYVAATPIKQYRMAPGSYLTYKAWRVVIIRDGVVVQGITEKNNLTGEKMAQEGLSDGETNNLSPEEQKPVKSPQRGKNKTSVADNPPTIEEIQAYMDERAAQGKPFIYVTAESFLDACEQSGWRLKDGKPMIDWRARMRTFENYRKEHGDRPVSHSGGGVAQTQPKAGDPIAATPAAKGKYKNKW